MVCLLFVFVSLLSIRCQQLVKKAFSKGIHFLCPFARGLLDQWVGGWLVGWLVVLDCYVIAFVVTLLRLLSCARNDSNMFVSYFCFCFHWFVVSFIGVLLFIIVLELLCTTSNLLLFLRPIFFYHNFCSMRVCVCI